MELLQFLPESLKQNKTIAKKLYTILGVNYENNSYKLKLKL